MTYCDLPAAGEAWSGQVALFSLASEVFHRLQHPGEAIRFLPAEPSEGGDFYRFDAAERKRGVLHGAVTRVAVDEPVIP